MSKKNDDVAYAVLANINQKLESLKLQQRIGGLYWRGTSKCRQKKIRRKIPAIISETEKIIRNQTRGRVINDNRIIEIPTELYNRLYTVFGHAD